MLNNNFDPYEMLIEIQERLSRLEHVHNKLAHAFERSEQELTQALHLLKALQQHHLKLRKDYDELKREVKRP